MIMNAFNSYEDGYNAGWEEGKMKGYNTGYTDASQEFEQRLSLFWVELQTLNARLDHLEQMTGWKNY